MCCGHSCECQDQHHGRHHGGGRVSWRRYVSPSEERETVEAYVSDLEKELDGARARLAEIKK